MLESERMKPLAWYVNAALRTARALLPSRFPPDDEFARRLLPEAEYELYIAMEPADRDHAVRVARELLSRRPDAPAVLVRAALLHDVGKSGAPFRLWQRVVAHLWSRDLPVAPRLDGLSGAQQRSRHHPGYGADMIRAAGGSEAVARLVERHHDPDGDPDAALLRSIDETT